MSRLSRSDLRAMHDRLLVAEAVPVPRIIRDVLADARRIYIEYLVTDRPSFQRTSRRGRDAEVRQLEMMEYSDEHGVEAAAEHFGVSMRRVYTVRHLVKKRGIA